MLFHVPKVLKSRQISHNHKHSTNFQVLMLTAGMTTVLDTILNPCLISLTTLSFSFLGTGAVIWRHQLDSFFNYLTKFSQKYKISCSALTVLGTFLLLDALSTPAQAQFFQTAETWMTGQFAGAEEAITLAFNVLRGLFILYLGISLVRVIQAARQDEDWTNLARTPMIILIAVTMGDILANLIIGGGGGGRGGGGAAP
jgi:hypothetical protein